MRTAVLTLAALAFGTAAAHAGIPTLNATCGNGIEVHADAGGPVYINGKQAKLHKFNEEYYEATHGPATVSISIGDDGSPSVSYTGQHGNGVCPLNGHAGNAGGGKARQGCPADVSQADRYKYPACN